MAVAASLPFIGIGAHGLQGIVCQATSKALRLNLGSDNASELALACHVKSFHNAVLIQMSDDLANALAFSPSKHALHMPAARTDKMLMYKMAFINLNDKFEDNIAVMNQLTNALWIIR